MRPIRHDMDPPCRNAHCDYVFLKSLADYHYVISCPQYDALDATGRRSKSSTSANAALFGRLPHEILDPDHEGRMCPSGELHRRGSPQETGDYGEYKVGLQSLLAKNLQAVRQLVQCPADY